MANRRTLGPSMGGGAPASSTAYPSPDLPISEQLMQLDQAITLTLQEIDENFARSHQIVTARILPAVKRYGIASAGTWQGARFWKHFFEVSANVSLSPENAADEDARSSYDPSTRSFTDEATTSAFEYDSAAGSPQDKRARAQAGDASDVGLGDDSDDLDQSGFLQSLRQASSPAGARTEPNWAPVESPFERLKKEVENEFGAGSTTGDVTGSAESVLEYHRQQREAGLRGETSIMDETAQGLSVGDESVERDRQELARGIDKIDLGPSRKSPGKPKPRGSLLSKVLTAEGKKAAATLPKIQATPGGAQKRNPFTSAAAGANAGGGGAAARGGNWNGIVDLTKTPRGTNLNDFSSSQRSKQPTTTPKSKSKSKAAGGASTSSKKKPKAAGDWDDSDSDDADSLAWPEGMSPPITMQFSVPQSRFHKTPAKEAARIMVDDLLRTVEGGGETLRERQREREKRMAEEEDRRMERLLTSTRKALPTPKGKGLLGASVGKSPGQRLGAYNATVVGTPLVKKTPKAAKSGAGAQKRRDSLPTPPTLTKRGGLTPPAVGGAGKEPMASTTPLQAGPAGGAAQQLGSGSKARQLLDEGEGGEDDDDGDEQVGETSVSLARTAENVDRMLQIDDDEEDESDSDDDSDDDDEDSVELRPSAAPGSVLGSAASSYRHFASASKNAQPSGGGETSMSYSGWTTSTDLDGGAASRGGAVSSLDQDTLFGIRDPLASRGGSAAPSASNASRGGTTQGGQPLGESQFKPWGAVEEQGTVYEGRPLLNESRDLTWSAPSPTPGQRG